MLYLECDIKTHTYSFFKKGVVLFLMLFALANSSKATTYKTISAGSYVIDMGVVPQTNGNGLRPYGLVYDMLKNQGVVVDWVLNPNKSKDGIDFSVDGRDFRGAPFVIDAAYRTAAVDAVISTWEASGVVGYTTQSDVFNVPIHLSLNNAPYWVLDNDNGSLVEGTFEDAGIPTSAYEFAYPNELTCCDDIFVLPHAEPEWATHRNMYSWVNSESEGGCEGWMWAACRGGSSFENLSASDDYENHGDSLLNFLTTDGLVLAGDHSSATPPYTYNHPTDPFMQFMGDLDGALNSGSEQVYMPYKSGSWRSTTKIGVYDPNQSDLPTLSNGPAAKIAFGPAFGDPTKGMVMYEAGHNMDGGSEAENVAAQRVFLNFGFNATYRRRLGSSTANIPGVIYGGQTTAMSVDIDYFGVTTADTVEWTCNCPGTFSDPTSLSTNFTPDSVETYQNCVIKARIITACDKVTHESKIVVVIPNDFKLKAINDSVIINKNGYVTIDQLANDTITNPTTLNVSVITSPSNGTFQIEPNNKITYLPNQDYVGNDNIEYQVCDTTNGICTTAWINIYVMPTSCGIGEAISFYLGHAQKLYNQNGIGNPERAFGPANNEGAQVKENTDRLIVNLEEVITEGSTVYFYMSCNDNGAGRMIIQSSATTSGFGNKVSYTDADGDKNTFEKFAYIVPSGGAQYFDISSLGNKEVYLDAVDYDSTVCSSIMPIAVDDKYTIQMNTYNASLDILVNDTPNDPLGTTTNVLTNPTKGTLFVNLDGSISYTPAFNFSGIDSFQYAMCNSRGVCDIANVSITIVEGGCGANYSVSDSKTIGIRQLNNPISLDNQANVFGLPDNNATRMNNSSDNLVADVEIALSAGTEVSFYLSAKNTTANITYITSSLYPSSGFGNPLYFTDVDGSENTFQQTIYTVPAGGARYFKINYISEEIYLDAVTYDSLTCSLSVNTVAIDDDNNTLMNMPVSGSVMTNDFDVEGDNQQFGYFMLQNGSRARLVSGSTVSGIDINGVSVVPNAGNITYNAKGNYTFNPAANFAGTVNLSYYKCDETGSCADANLKIIVTPYSIPGRIENSVIANNDDYVSFGNPIYGTLLSNDMDPEENGFSISNIIIKAPGSENVTKYKSISQAIPIGGYKRNGAIQSTVGMVQIDAAGNFAFNPADAFTGSIYIGYEVCDDQKGNAKKCHEASIKIQVIDPASSNHRPFAGDDFAAAQMNVAVEGSWRSNDYDDNTDDILLNGMVENTRSEIARSSVVEYPTQKGGSVAFYDDGTYTFTPKEDYYGPDQIRYQVCDIAIESACDSATIYFIVMPRLRDFGDLDLYPIASHLISLDENGDNIPDVADAFWLGATVDGELTSLLTADGSGDDNDGLNDDDGLILGDGLWLGTTSIIKVIINANTSGRTIHFGLWIDWNIDGVFDSFYADYGISSSPDTVEIAIAIPESIAGQTVNMRLRAFESAPVFADFEGHFNNGEVEDYSFMNVRNLLLPIELSAFTATPINQEAVQLDWTTSAEVNNDFFTIERSSNAVSWDLVGYVEGAGMSQTELDYQLIDDQPLPGKSYYRLKQTDYDGTFSYSDIRVVNMDQQVSIVDFKIYPNPSNGIVNLQMTGEVISDEVYAVNLYGMGGNLVHSTVISSVDRNTSLDLHHLPSGTYVVSIQAENQKPTSYLIEKN